MNRIIASTIALALLGAGTAHANTAEVRIGDLNLASAAGKAELDRRIESAARRVCIVDSPVATRIDDRSEQSRCKAEVRAQVAAALPI